MNRVRLLPEQVANQIAAGEVIERPASVVKELVENAIDAGAVSIRVEVQAGGRSLVRVIDDGIGMSRDDALLCLERHATSKIVRAEDLAAITTMGFRGEALPSIASVSRFTLTTREKDAESPEGTQIVISGGKILEVKAAGCAPGTSIEARQLFFNLPARRKFLRTEETECAHIQHYVTLAALAFPEVGFTLQRDGRILWQLPPVKSGGDIPARLAALRERLRALYGGEQKLLAVDFSAELPSLQVRGQTEIETTAPFRLWGYIGAPGVSRSTREDQHLFVNRRPVENRGLNFALLEGYHTALMKGRYPVCCLFLEIEPAAVDVNIHPAKREVRFHRESEVRRLVSQAVRETLVRYHSKGSAISSAPAGPHGGPGVPPNVPASLASGRDPAPAAKQAPLPMGFGHPPPGLATTSSPSPALRREVPRPENAMAARQPAGTPPNSTPPTTPGAASPEAPDPALLKGEPVPLLNVALRLIGVVGKLYALFESDRGLVLLDQHAAHERILFEQVLNRLEQHEQAPSQRLLLPETLEFSVRDSPFLKQQLPILTRLGVGLSEFGERTFMLDALPPFVKATDPRQFVLELVDELKAAGEAVNTLRLGEHTIAKLVCRHAVKAHDPLAGKELENLVNDLRQCAMPYTCPHGRPTLIEMNFRELEKKFGRSH